MSEMFSNDAHQIRKHPELQVGLRLSRSRFVLLSELYTTSESGVYWLAEDRDEDCQVTLYFPPIAICKEVSLLELFFQRVNEWMDSTDEDWHRIRFLDSQSKPYPLIALSIGSSDSLENQLIKEGLSSNWEDIEPHIEKVVQHAVQMHQANLVHGRLSSDNIRFTEHNDVVFVGLQLDRIVLQILQEHFENPLPKSWDLHASPECLETCECHPPDEVYAIASILLESIRNTGIHVKLPKQVELEGKVRFGNLLVPKSVKQALMDALDEDLANRPNTAFRLSALLGFSIENSMDVYEDSSLEMLTPDASERTRILIRSLLHPKVIGVLFLFLAIFLGGWMIADWNQKKVINQQAKQREDLNNILALDVRDAAPNDLNGLIRQGSSTLIVRTSPTEALLTLSGPGILDVQEEFSPATWHQLQDGAYQLSVLAVGYAPTNIYPFLEMGKTNVVEIELSEPKTNVEFVTEPAGGAYRFQGVTGDWITGLTPDSKLLPIGEYLVHFSMNGQNVTKSIHITRYQSRGIKVVASFGECRLQLNTYPESAEVYINAELKGVTPLTLDGLASGEISVELRKPGYLTHQQAMTIDSEQLNTLRILLKKDSSIPGSD